MPSALTTYFGNRVLSGQGLPSKVYLGLFTADPGVLGSFADEVAGGDYVRQLFPKTAPGSKTIGNASQLVFDNLPATTIYHLALCDAQYAGNILAITPRLSPGVSIPDSAKLVIPAGEVVFTL